jgi:TonB family protein
MRAILHIAVLVVGTVLVTHEPLRGAQVPPDIGRLAAKTTGLVAKTDAHRILTTPLASCFVASELCAELDTALHTELENSIPGAQFISREDAAKPLSRYGFLSIDAYLGALDDVASDAGTEVVISESVFRKGSRCELRTRVADVKHLFELGDFGVRVSCTTFSREALPPLKDPESGAFLIIPVQAGLRPVDRPSCVSCPHPHYTGYAQRRRVEGDVRVLITVTEQGTVENLREVGAVEDGLARASIQAIHGWQFKPAIGEDGKPFPARVLVGISFRWPGTEQVTAPLNNPSGK